MPKKKTRNHRLDDSDDDVPSFITAEDLENVEAEEEQISKKVSNKKKDRKAKGMFCYVFEKR